MSSPLLVLAAALAIPHSRIAVRFAPDSRLPPLVVATAIREAAVLWSPAGIVVESARAIDEAETITVRVEPASPEDTGGCSDGGRQRPAVCLREVLASARFVNGKPTGVITLFVDGIVRLVERGRLAGTGERQWPKVMRQRLIGRALGRVIAHELGHIMLESREHAARGLMQASHRAPDLIEPGRAPFQLR